jgi:hypothetical protein
LGLLLGIPTGALAEAGVGPDLRRDDVELGQSISHVKNVMPATAAPTPISRCEPRAIVSVRSVGALSLYRVLSEAWLRHGERVRAGLLRGLGYCIFQKLMAAGPRMTRNSTGKKNTIMGTVSFGGRAAAFFSASDMRMSRFSLAITRSAWPTGVP